MILSPLHDILLDHLLCVGLELAEEGAIYFFCLGFQQGFTTIIQYWRSFEHLEAYARNNNKEHFPEWMKFNKRVGSNGDVGIWHETFKVTDGNYECIYNNMPLFGLAKASKAVAISGKKDSANGRMGKDETTS